MGKFLTHIAQFLQQVLSKDTLQSFVYHTTKFLSKMSGIQPVAVYAMKVPPGDILVPAVPEFAAMFRVTMAAIDPSSTRSLGPTEWIGCTPLAPLPLVAVLSTGRASSRMLSSLYSMICTTVSRTAQRPSAAWSTTARRTTERSLRARWRRSAVWKSGVLERLFALCDQRTTNRLAA